MSETNNNTQYDRLDSNGLLYVFQRLRTIFSGMFQSQESGKGLSTNDYTTAEKEKLAGVAAGATANAGTVTGVSMNGNPLTVDQYGNVDLGTVITSHQSISGKADLNSPEFSGTPTVPTAATSTNNTQIASTAFVKNALAAALDGRTELDFQFLDALPLTGVKGVFYFIPNADADTNDVWVEYVWDDDNEVFEKIGSATVDLTGYFNTTNLPAITNAQIDTILATT